MCDEVREIPVKKLYQVNCTESVATSFVHKLLCHHTEQSCKPDPTNPNMDHFHTQGRSIDTDANPYLGWQGLACETAC